MKHFRLAALRLSCLLCAALGTANAGADDSGLIRCRGMADAAARLACYDALPLARPAASPAAPVAPVARVAPAAAAPAAVRTVPAGALPAASPPEAFGLEQQRDRQLNEIASRIVGTFEGWGPRSRIRLDNGQVWQISDDSTAVVYLSSPAVKVVRAVLGGFVMDIEGAPRSPRVRRLE